MRVVAIDPGPEQSAFVVWDIGRRRVTASGKWANEELRAALRRPILASCDWLAIEKIASYGMPVGEDIFETVFWSGRFVEAWPGDWVRIDRRQIKLELCSSARAKDANVRQALIDRVGPPGTKRKRGPTYGLKGDMWAALAVAVVASRSY